MLLGRLAARSVRAIVEYSVIMSDAAKKLLRDALALSAEERRELGEALLESARAGDLDPRWEDEVIRRLEDVRAGREPIVAGPEVRARVVARLRAPK